MRGTFHRLLFAIVLLAIGVSLWLAIQRLFWESAYHRVGLVIPYQELDASNLTGYLTHLKAQGVVGITIELSAFPDWSLDKVSGDEKFSEVVQLANEVGMALGFVVEAADTTTERELAQRLSDVVGIKPRFLIAIATTEATSRRLKWMHTDIQAILHGPEALVGIVEFSEPGGALDLYQQGWQGFVRTHAIKSRELDRLGLEGALARWERAIQERNIRLLWVTEHQHFPNYLDHLSQRIERLGFTLGAPPQPTPFETSCSSYLLIGLGAVSLLLLLGSSFLEINPTSLVSLGVVGAGLVVLMGLLDLSVARQMVAFALALLAPWAILILIKEHLSGLALLVTVSAGSVMAGLGIAALLSDVTYFLKLDEFRGVKIALIAPSLLAILAELIHWGYPGLASLKAQLRRGAWLVPAAGLSALFLVLERSGNLPSIPVARWEEFLRERLEDLMIARPRFKEFLTGHPALLLLRTQRSGSPSLPNLSLLALGVLGQASIINTFAHLHTPLLLSLWRTLNGLTTGIVVGLILWSMLHMLKWLRSQRL